MSYEKIIQTLDENSDKQVESEEILQNVNKFSDEELKMVWEFLNQDKNELYKSFDFFENLCYKWSWSSFEDVWTNTWYFYWEDVDYNFLFQDNWFRFCIIIGRSWVIKFESRVWFCELDVWMEI